MFPSAAVRGECVVLTANLARSRTTDEEVKPLFIDPTDGRYRETARELIQLFDDHLGEPKGDLEDSIDELTVADTDYKNRPGTRETPERRVRVRGHRLGRTA